LMTSLKVEIKSPDGKPLADGTYEKTERYGVLLADVADRALKAARPATLTPFDLRSRPLFLPIDNKVYLVARQLGVLDRAAFLGKGRAGNGAHGARRREAGAAPRHPDGDRLPPPRRPGDRRHPGRDLSGAGAGQGAGPARPRRRLPRRADRAVDLRP